MMKRYHINHSGNPGICSATKSCPFGDLETGHYASKEEARASFEKEMQSGVVANPVRGATRKSSFSLSGKRTSNNAEMTSVVQRKRSNRLQKIGLTAGALMAVAACSQQVTQEPVNYEYSSSPTATAEPEAVEFEDEDAPSYSDRLKDAYGKAKDGYEKNWKDKVNKAVEDYENFLDDYETAPPSNQGYSKYDRKAFKHWTDTNNNNCDTRQDILQRDLTNVNLASDNCTVLSGKLDDPYTGITIDYVKGNNSIDIDHVAPLSWAWENGAYAWSDAQREAFANDPDNLLAVQASANRSKGSQTPATWTPINRAKACEYGSIFLNVAQKYNLKVSENDLSSVKAAC